MVSAWDCHIGIKSSSWQGYTVKYHIAGHFRGVLIFVIFVVHLGVAKFSTHENFPHTVALTTCAQIWTGDVLLRLFFTTCSALGPPCPLSQCKLSHV